MATAALIIGVLGGLAGIVSAMLGLAVGGITAAVGDAAATGGPESGMLVGISWAAFAASFVGILGAGLTPRKPRLGAVLLLLAGLAVLLFISWFAVIATPLLLIAALLAFLVPTSRPEDRPLPRGLPHGG